MVPQRGLALTPTDRLLAGYLGFVTLVIVVRGVPPRDAVWLIVMHLLFGALLWLFTRLTPAHRLGRFLHAYYPVLMLVPFYREFGIIHQVMDPAGILAHDLAIQSVETAVFGSQVSYQWIRQWPSVFWSGVLHLAYFGFYPIVVFGPLVLYARAGWRVTSATMFSMMLAFVACYVVFLTWPVAGPYYAFPDPSGPVREVFSARWVYAVLEDASAIGTAFPSSHVASTVAFVAAAWRYRRDVAAWFVIPCVLLTIGTVYCQMHYGVDALAGVLVGAAAAWVGTRGVHPVSAGASAPPPGPVSSAPQPAR